MKTCPKFRTGARTSLRDRLIAAHGMCCCWCGCTTTLKGKSSQNNYCTIEHLLRRVDGGRSNMDNCRIACRACNNGRHAILNHP